MTITANTQNWMVVKLPFGREDGRGVYFFIAYRNLSVIGSAGHHSSACRRNSAADQFVQAEEGKGEEAGARGGRHSLPGFWVHLSGSLCAYGCAGVFAVAKFAVLGIWRACEEESTYDDQMGRYPFFWTSF